MGSSRVHYPSVTTMLNCVLRKIRRAIGNTGMTLREFSFETGVPIGFFFGTQEVNHQHLLIVESRTGIPSKEIIRHPLVRLTTNFPPNKTTKHNTHMKKFASIAALLVLACPAFAQQKTISGPAITGVMNIQFNTRQRINLDSSGLPNKGIKDIYKVDLKVNSVVIIRGTIERQPRLVSKILGREVQRGQIFYKLGLFMQTPNGPVAVGDWLGTVVTDDRGYYLFDGSGDINSKPRIQTQAVGNQVAFTDYFGGVMLGKGTQPKGAMKFVRMVKGKQIAYTATNTDPMEFRNLVLAKGPLGTHARTTVDGKLIYDRESGSWITEGINFLFEGKKDPDIITGSIRWIEDPNRASSGKGEYSFNLRWNEAKQGPSEENFSGTNVDEESFFAVDTSKPGLTGNVAYLDQMDGEAVVASTVTYNLVANTLERSQVLAWAKLWLCGVGPINDE